METTTESTIANQKNKKKLQASDNSGQQNFEKGKKEFTDTDESSNKDLNEHNEKNQMQKGKLY